MLLFVWWRRRNPRGVYQLTLNLDDDAGDVFLNAQALRF
jgi:hypothetical protein